MPEVNFDEGIDRGRLVMDMFNNGQLREHQTRHRSVL